MFSFQITEAFDENRQGLVLGLVFDGGHHGIFTDMKAKITRAVEQKLQSLI